MASIRPLLESLLGVWEGTYTHLTPSGEVIERLQSRQELRLIGDAWYERIIYKREGQEPEVRDFRGRFEGDDLVIDDPDFHGEATLLEDNVLVFPYHWKSRPEVRILETVMLPTSKTKVRTWQTFDSGELSRVTLIQEEFLPEAQPDTWE